MTNLVKPCPELNDLLDDLDHHELTALLGHLWLSGAVKRASIKSFRKRIGKPVGEPDPY